VKEEIREFLSEHLPKELEKYQKIYSAEELVTKAELLEAIRIIEQRFEAMDKRFEELIDSMNRKFDAVDKRFEAMDKRFEELIDSMNRKFEAVDKRFEAVDKRFEELIDSMNRKFDAVDKRFEAMDRQAL